jgi:hypothetical protein
VPYYFLRDIANGTSTAEQEWLASNGTHPNEMARIFTHIQRVEAAQSVQSHPLKQAIPIPGRPDPLYAWGAGGVWAFYLYDGVDLVVVLVGVIANPPAFPDLRTYALARI